MYFGVSGAFSVLVESEACVDVFCVSSVVVVAFAKEYVHVVRSHFRS